MRGGRGSPVSSAAWSPDGTRIAYVVGDTLILQERGGTPQPLTTMPEPNQCSWSPDGARIACGSGNSQYTVANQQFGNLSPSRIVVVRIADRSVGYATDNASANQSPVWADNQRLIFESSFDRKVREMLWLRKAVPLPGSKSPVLYTCPVV